MKNRGLSLPPKVNAGISFIDPGAGRVCGIPAFVRDAIPLVPLPLSLHWGLL